MPGDKDTNMLPPEALDAMNQRLNTPPADDEEEMNPWTKQFYQSFLKSYGYNNPAKKRTGFGRRYDRIYAPFYAGASNARMEDMIPNRYRMSTPWDSPEQIKQTYHHNAYLDSLSSADPLITAGSHGLGLAYAAGGGIPAFIGGMAIKHGGPVLWNLAKQYLASRKAHSNVAAENYRRILENHPNR
jgi:hypothetical protein